MATLASSRQFMYTSGATDPVWVKTEPVDHRPKFDSLKQDTETEVCIVGSGIVGISTAYELVKRGVEVILVEAREILSGETGRTSGHLSSALDDGYINIKARHGEKGAIAAAKSHQWALEHVGEVARELGIDCEYKRLPAYQVSQYERGHDGHADDVKELKDEIAYTQELGLDSTWKDDYAVKGWDGKKDQRDAAVFGNQATFHPTKYLNGVLEWLIEQPNFKCYTNSRVLDIKEKGVEILGFGSKEVSVVTEGGKSITCKDAVMATCVPLQKLSVVAEMEFHRTYCLAIRIPKGSYEDCLLYDTADAYKYVRFTACDEKDDYLVIGGQDHKVGQLDDEASMYGELETWVRDRFTKAGAVDYKWSGQIYEPGDFMAFIGRNPGTKHTYITTGDSGNGLTHGVIASQLLSDLIQEVENPWTELYSPNRIASIVKSAQDIIPHDLQINAQYKRLLQSDITDIEDLAPGTGGVLNPKTSKPIAVYKTEDGEVRKMSAFCPHMKGVVCWNSAEQSWDCPVHASRFSKEGICVNGPAKGNLPAEDDAAKKAQQAILAA